MKIGQITAREILDTKGNPTIEAIVTLSDGTMARSSAPTGAMKGTYEAQALRDGDKDRYLGLGVLQAIDIINTQISPKLIGFEATEQQKIDAAIIELDGTSNKSKLGGNTTIAVSQAVCKAAAKSALLPLSLYIRQFISLHGQAHRIPTPMFNLIEGGKHAENSLNFQEFLVIPATSHTLSESLEIGVSMYHKLREYIKDNNQSVLSADEGGFAPAYATNMDALRTLRTTIEMTKYGFLKDIFLGVDISANGFIYNKKYAIKDKNGQLDDTDLMEVYQNMLNDFSLVYFEDPFAEDDWESWKRAVPALKKKSLLVGDDFFVTNVERLKKGIEEKAATAILIKPNQIGTLSETIETIQTAQAAKFAVIISHRSGETDSTFIADLCTASGAEYIKTGSLSRSERVEKYNRLMEIELEMNKKA